MLHAARHDRMFLVSCVAAILLAFIAIADVGALALVGISLTHEEREMVDFVTISAAVTLSMYGVVRLARRAEAARLAAEEALADVEIHVAIARALQNAGSQEEMMAAFCRAVTARGAVLAWAGVPQPDGSVHVVASDGDRNGYLDGLDVRWDAGALAGGLVGGAITTGTSRESRDLTTDPAVAPWRARLTASGLRSALALPIRSDGVPVGVLMAYWAVPGSRSPATRAALERAAADLGRGLAAIRRTAELAAASARVQAVLDASPMPILVFGPDHRVTYANGHAVSAFGHAGATLIGVSVADMVPAGNAPSHLELPRADPVAAPAVHPSDRHGVLARRLDGSTFPADVALAPISLNGQPHVVCMVSDLSHRLALEGRLVQAEKMEAMGQLAGILAHDLRNYLGAVRGLADLVLMDGPEDGAMHDDLLTLEGVVDDAVALIGNVLALARPAPVDAAPRCSVTRAVDTVLPVVQRAVSKRVAVEVAVPDDLPDVPIAASQLGQVLLNLATNANSAMPDGGRIRITATPDPSDLVRISVEDSGTGMTPDVAAHLFDPFFTTHGGEGRGTGLGLTSVKLLVDRAGGVVAVESTPGIGSIFTITLPAVREAYPLAS